VEAKRRKRGLTEYFVRWKDHPPSENTWEPMANLQGSEQLVNTFEKEWQARYDNAKADNAQARTERRRAERLPAQKSAASTRKPESYQNRVLVAHSLSRLAL
jgi:hypothetical protein